MTSRWKDAGLAAAAAALILSSPAARAASAPKPPGRAELVRELSDCRAIADPTARLACFDKAAEALDQAQAKGDVIVVDRQEVRAVKRQAFGFNFDALAIFDRGGQKDVADDTINTVAKSVTHTAVGKWIITLEDGAVWRQIDAETLSFDPHEGSKIRIHKAALGSFMMNVDGQTGIRVHRDQ